MDGKTFNRFYEELWKQFHRKRRENMFQPNVLFLFEL